MCSEMQLDGQYSDIKKAITHCNSVLCVFFFAGDDDDDGVLVFFCKMAPVFGGWRLSALMTNHEY